MKKREKKYYKNKTEGIQFIKIYSNPMLSQKTIRKRWKKNYTHSYKCMYIQKNTVIIVCIQK